MDRPFKIGDRVRLLKEQPWHGEFGTVTGYPSEKGRVFVRPDTVIGRAATNRKGWHWELKWVELAYESVCAECGVRIRDWDYLCPGCRD